MPPHPIEIVSPSRLHFGLYSFGHADRRQYGGVGVMIDSPAVRMTIRPAEDWNVVGPLAERADEFARRWVSFYGMGTLPQARLDVVAAPPEHVGLGLGTQLGLSVAALLARFVGWPMPAPEELAASVGRGLRSAVGTHGFAAGGLIAERGKLPGETIAPLDCRIELPSTWRFVLVVLPGNRGLSGGAERRAFGDLPAVPGEVTESLIQEARDRLFPAAAQGDFARFSRSLYEFGRQAGQCFAAHQGGPYNGPELTDLVFRLRELGLEGVGQSSWGPTIFAASSDEATAQDVVTRLRPGLPDGTGIWITAPNATGACCGVCRDFV